MHHFFIKVQDFLNQVTTYAANQLPVLVQRSVVHDRVDSVKTEYSQDLMPLDPSLAALMIEWRSLCLSGDGTGVSESCYGSPISSGTDPEALPETGREKSWAGVFAGLSHVPSHVSSMARRYWRTNDGSATANAPRQYSDDDERLRTGNARYKTGGESKNRQMVLGDPKKPTGTG
jgi:hypothetical protein